MKFSFGRRSGLALVGAATLSIVAATMAVPAQADGQITFTPSAVSGTTGVQTTIGFQIDPDCALVGSPTMPVTPIGSNSGPAPVVQATIAKNYFLWVPPQTDYWTFQSAWTNCNSVTSTPFRSNTVSSKISVSAANTAQVGQPTTLTATVTATNGAQASAVGTIQFAIVGGGAIGGPVNLNGSIPAQATINWTPPANGTYQITATYAPANNNGYVNVSCPASCTSPPDSITVTGTGVKMYLANPPAMSAGTTTNLTAVVSVSPPSGSVTFLINGAPIANNVPVQANGQAVAPWTPPAPGQYTVKANWVGNGGQTASSQETVTVGTAPVNPDSITVSTAGGPVWPPNSSVSIPNGTTVTLVGTTASGAPVSFTESGPCNLNGNQLTVDTSNGSCRITARSNGGNGYGPNQATYTVAAGSGAQSADLAAPPSGSYKKSQVLTLETPQQGTTNAGQQVKWTIKPNSKKVCSLGFPSSGAVTLKFKKKGYCTVYAKAPAVGSQWRALNQPYTYRAY